jgi:transcription initiation factor IIF auxiliary subunit
MELLSSFAFNLNLRPYTLRVLTQQPFEVTETGWG